MSSPGMPTIEQYFEPNLLALLTEIYKQRNSMNTEENIYSCYARSNVVQGETVAGFDDLLLLMCGFSAVMMEFSGQGIKCTLQVTKRKFSDAFSDVLAVTKQNGDDLQISYCTKYLTEFFYLSTSDYDSRLVKARVAVHILDPYVTNANRVVRALARGLSSAHGFPSMKVCGPGATGRTDHIVCYLYESVNRERIIQLLGGGDVSACIGNPVPPTMLLLQAGVAFAEEPPNVPTSYINTPLFGTIKNPLKYNPSINPYNIVQGGETPQDSIILHNKQRTSFGEFHTQRIWAGLVKWRAKHTGELNDRFRFQLFLFEVYQAYLRKGVQPHKPYEFTDRAGAEEKWFAKYTFKNRL